MNWNRKSPLFAAGTLFLAAASINPGTLKAQVGFVNGAKARHITPGVGVDPKAPAAVIAAAVRG